MTRASIALPACLAVLLLFADVSAAHPATDRTPRCFGAAARDPARTPCRNPRLRLSVTPTPRRAVLDPGAPCKPLKAEGPLVPCAFGAPQAKAKERFALIGDSHAAHWRSGLAAIAPAHRWRGYALVHKDRDHLTQLFASTLGPVLLRKIGALP